MGYYIGIIGLNHKTAALDIRESLGFSPSECEDALEKLKKLYPSNEYTILSTCNRVEIYVGNTERNILFDDIINFMSSYHNIPKDDILPFIYTYRGEEAIRHLFEVASGIDSLVIGETQILGQMKTSYHRALELGLTGKVLNRAFQKAFVSGKKVRTLTGIGRGNVSISSVSCLLAEEFFEDFSQRKVLLIGTGKIGKLTLKSLRDKGASTILVSSRNYEKAKILAEEFNGIAITFREIEDFIVEADVVISATSAPCFILHADMLKKIMGRRNNEPLFLIDLAVPRDIDPAIRCLAGVHLYNVDSLRRIAGENMKKRYVEIFRCREIIAEEVNFFIQQTDRTLLPSIQALPESGIINYSIDN